jgi:hypothetical protein
MKSVGRPDVRSRAQCSLPLPLVYESSQVSKRPEVVAIV